MMRVKKYLAFCFGWSWTLWIIAIIFGSLIPVWFIRLLHYAGGIGPLMSVLLILRGKSKQFKSDFWKRTVSFGQISFKYYLVIIFLVPVISGLGAISDILLGGEGLKPELLEVIINSPFSALYLLLFFLLFGPVPEELGWRGVLLPQLQVQFNPIKSSMIVGMIWALWHFPLFFIKGTYQQELGIGSVEFLIFNLMIFITAFSYTWLYNKTKGSILSAILFHLSVNFYGELVELSFRAEVISVLFWIVFTLAVILNGEMKRETLL